MHPFSRLAKLFKSRIFRRQFFSFSALVAGAAVLFSAAISVRTSSDLARSHTAIAEKYRDQIKAHIGDWLDGKISAVTAFASVMGDASGDELHSEQTTHRIVQVVNAYGDFTDIIIVDQTGKVVNARQSGAAYKRVFVGDREYYKEALAGPVGVTGFFAGRNTGRQVMTMAKRFQSTDGGTYVAVAFITLERFAGIIDALNKEGLAVAYMVDADARKLMGATAERHEQAEGENPKLTNPAAAAAAKGESGVVQYRDSEGERILGAYTAIRDLDVGLVVELKRELFMEPIEQLQSFVFMIGALGVLLALAIAFALSSQVFRPIEELIQAVDGIAASDYSRRIELSTGNELDALIERFNRMQQLIAQRETNLKDDASRDSLTGLYNHGAVMEYLNRAAAAKGDAAVCFAMIDIDHFKRVNDEYGHQAGDAVLVKMAALLKAAVRGDDLVGRYGGEEFAVVLRERRETDNEAFCERLRERIERAEFSHEGRKIPITASIGWACLRAGDTTSPDTLVGAADAALYRAKANGRNRVERG